MEGKVQQSGQYLKIFPDESLLSLDDEGHFDPHIWWDANCGWRQPKVVATGLSNMIQKILKHMKKPSRVFDTIRRT